MRTRLRLHHRIVIPFVLIAVVAISAAAYAALWAASAAMEARVTGQLISAAGVVGRGDFALNRAILGSVREITGADIVTFAADGTLLATTVDTVARPDLIASVTAARATLDTSGPPKGAFVVKMDCGVPCFVAFRQVEGMPDVYVALVAEAAELAAATPAVTRTVLLATVFSVVVMMVVSQVVARRVTAPLARLSGFARELSLEAPHHRAPTGEDEVGRLAAAFNDMLDRVEQSQAAVVRAEKLALAGLLAARVAHDIRNPLSSIKMQAQLLHTSVESADDQAALSAILHDIDQVESVISDLLELARPGELTLRPTQINMVVHDVLRQLSAQLAHRKIDVALDLEQPLPVVPLDANRFKQALINVIMNASDAMHTGGKLMVSSRLLHGEVVIEVHDDGIGVDPSMLERVFDPFVSTKRDGVGLGLVNARAVVASHGGRVALERRHPHGTIARICLPVSPQLPEGAALP